MYLIIGYKDSYEDYCRGCHMGTQGSDSTIKRVITPQEAAEFIANIEVFDKNQWANWNWTVVTAKMIDDEDEYFDGDLASNNIPNEVLEFLDNERQKAKNKLNAEIANKNKLKKQKEEMEQLRIDTIEFEKLKIKLGK